MKIRAIILIMMFISIFIIGFGFMIHNGNIRNTECKYIIYADKYEYYTDTIRTDTINKCIDFNIKASNRNIPNNINIVICGNYSIIKK